MNGTQNWTDKNVAKLVIQKQREELEREIGFLMALQEMDLDDMKNSISPEICKFIEIEMKFIENRLKEIEAKNE